jgi:hypothetical protein
VGSGYEYGGFRGIVGFGLRGEGNFVELLGFGCVEVEISLNCWVLAAWRWKFR